ncbi:hypothetical protein BaRGS_00026886 [Batillaria attramentaria]|uniref:Uncharacterized protein n=1 Tax=Batillaria attramentaria TaxID=370345 RepID=A0ABD0K4L2_9CAEN
MICGKHKIHNHNERDYFIQGCFVEIRKYGPRQTSALSQYLVAHIQTLGYPLPLHFSSPEEAQANFLVRSRLSPHAPPPPPSNSPSTNSPQSVATTITPFRQASAPDRPPFSPPPTGELGKGRLMLMRGLILGRKAWFFWPSAPRNPRQHRRALSVLH